MPTLDNLPKPEMSDDVAQELGRYIAAFNWMEGILGLLLRELVDPHGAHIEGLLGQMMFRGMLEAARNTVPYARANLTNDFRKRIVAVLTKLGRAAEHRNDYAHSEWRLIEGLGVHSMAKRKRDGTGKFRAQTADTIRKARQELEQLATELASLVDEYIAQRGAAQ